jgi:ABC-2 type transport system ATP-binding protein
MFKIKNLSARIDNKLIFDHASLQLKKGEIIWLQGENGSGKTTFLKILAYLIHPENIGNELSLSIDQQKISLEELKYHLTFIPSQPYLFDYLTGNENIEYLMSLFNLED